MGRPLHYLDLDALVLINEKVVAITGERHEHGAEDDVRMRAVLKSAEDAKGEGDPFSDILEKTSLLMFRIASGQNFHEGNKRTALVAGAAFLRLNGFSLNIKSPELVSVVDRAGMSAATMDDVRAVLRDRIERAKKGTKAVGRTVAEIVKANREFLNYIASENRGSS